jgi:A/G-specific adenine glycosylase
LVPIEARTAVIQVPIFIPKSTNTALEKVEEFGLETKEIYRQVEKKHIFTHIQWNMNGVYLEVAEQGGPFSWLSGEEIETSAALPTAFRQFWEEAEYV